MLNSAIKVAAVSKGIRMWQIADRLGVHESTLSKRLRKELDASEQAAIIEIINQIAREQDQQ